MIRPFGIDGSPTATTSPAPVARHGIRAVHAQREFRARFLAPYVGDARQVGFHREVIDHVDNAIAGPTATLEPLPRGPISAVFPQSGYKASTGIVGPPINDLDATLRKPAHVQRCAKDESLYLRTQGEQQRSRHYPGDRFYAQVLDGILGAEAPAIRPATLAERLALFRHKVVH